MFQTKSIFQRWMWLTALLFMGLFLLSWGVLRQLSIAKGFEPDSLTLAALERTSPSPSELVTGVDLITNSFDDPHPLVGVGNQMVFHPQDETSLWLSNGAVLQTTLLKDLETRIDSVYEVNDRVVAFVGSGDEIWVSDDSLTEMMHLYTMPRQYGYLNYSYLPANATPHLYFFTYKNTLTQYDQRTLWRTDGTLAGTFPLRSFDAVSDWTSAPVVIGADIFFEAWTESQGLELWTSDGSVAGTKLVKDLNPGVGNSSPHQMTAAGDDLLFFASDQANEVTLWLLDHTNSSVNELITVSGELSNWARHMAVLGDQIIFVNQDPAHGVELWVTDDTGSSTMLMSDINPGAAGSSPGSLIVLSDRILFTAETADTGRELWRTDGTADGTKLVLDIFPGPELSMSTLFQVNSEMVAFAARDTFGNLELWLSTGQASETAKYELYPGPNGSSPHSWAKTTDRVYFAADHPDYGTELWAFPIPGTNDPLVEADFVMSARIGVVPFQASFENRSRGDFTSSSWTFGDGGTSMLENPTHVYTEPGVYTVTLTVDGPGGQDDYTVTGVTAFVPATQIYLPLMMGK